MLETLKEEKQRYNDCQKTLCFRSRGNYKKGEDYKVSRSTLDFFSNLGPMGPHGTWESPWAP